MPNANGVASTAGVVIQQGLGWQTVVTVPLTPSTTSKKVLVKTSISVSVTGREYHIRLRRGSTTIRELSAIQSGEAPPTGLLGEPFVIEALDSPTSTSQQNYTLEAQRDLTGSLTVEIGTFLTATEL